MSLLRQQIDRMRSGMDTERYHTVKTLRVDTVAHHSHGVAMLAMLMAQGWDPVDRCLLLEACLMHDLPEGGANPMVALGDMPSPAKRAIKGMRAAFAVAERDMMQPIELDHEMRLRPWQHRTLKLADNLDGMFNCAAEVALGSKVLMPTYESYRDYVWEQNPRNIERDIFDVAQDYYEEAIVGLYGSKPYVRK